MLPSFEPPPPADSRDVEYDDIAERFAAPLARLAQALEQEHDARERLLQDIHGALYHGLTHRKPDIPLRAWVFRVAHNCVISHEPELMTKESGQLTLAQLRERRKRRRAGPITLDGLRNGAGPFHERIYRLPPRLRQHVLLYLEELSPNEISLVTGESVSSIESKIEDIRRALPPDAIQVWQAFGGEAWPVRRALLIMRRFEKDKSKRQKDRAGLMIWLVLSFMFLGKLIGLNSGSTLYYSSYGVALLVPLLAALHEWRRSRAEVVVDDRGSVATVPFLRRERERELEQASRPTPVAEWLMLPPLAFWLLSLRIELDRSWALVFTLAALILGILTLLAVVRRRRRTQLLAELDSLSS